MFTYHLPPELIAQTPAEPRDSARLLSWPERREHIFSTLPDLLTPGDLLVINTSKVIPARLHATRLPGEGQGAAQRGSQRRSLPVEIFLLHPQTPDFSRWEILARPARRLKEGDEIELTDTPLGTIHRAGTNLELVINKNIKNILEFIEKNGETPLPPYIRPPAEQASSSYIRNRYQTVYADPTRPGSVAAPTAGLHFTPEVFARLKAKGVNVAEVTLHVGAGTFQNPTPEQLASGKLHAEWAALPQATAEAIAQTRAHGGNVVAVGTTALRTLESWAAQGSPAQGWSGETTLFIRPGYRFAVADRLLTNFHLPGSSLLMLVAAFIGEAEIAELYQHAMSHGFRFYSFGDTSLLTRKDA